MGCYTAKLNLAIPGPVRRPPWTRMTDGEREAGVQRVIVIIALASVPAFADDVYLRGGGQITGEIVARSEDSVTVDIGGGHITANMSSVVRIEASTSPLQVYRERAEGIPDGDTEAWRELARWAKGEALSSQAAEAYLQVLAVLPDDEEANRALGHVPLDGRWVSEEESYRAQGYVYFEHEWMTPSEKQSILTERRNRQAAERQAVEAEIKAIEAEQAADKQREAQEEAERKARYNSLPQLGDPIRWGWGTGPAYWPYPSGGR